MAESNSGKGFPELRNPHSWIYSTCLDMWLPASPAVADPAVKRSRSELSPELRYSTASYSGAVYL